MPTVPLSAAQRAKLSTASAAAIETATARLAKYLPYHRWLGTNNRYLRRAVTSVIRDAGAPQNVDHKHLAEYIAASAVLHSADGWAYLGRALGAHCRGDAAVARHLAYYAELRAALALLATQGIGIFTKRNVVIDRAGNAGFFSGPTHPTTWLALEYWANSPDGAALLSTVIQPGGQPLQDWVAGLGLGGGVWSPIGREWLRTWGVDLRLFTRDRDARNEASYRPTTLRRMQAVDSVADADFVRRFWPLFEPTPGDPFRQLDRHLLRLTLERAFQSTTGHAAVGDPAFQAALNRTLLANVGLGLASPLGRFLSRQDEPENALLFDAAQTRASHIDPRHHAHVIARAALLLRVATGANLYVLEAAQLSVQDYRFWCERLAEDHGLCQPGNFPPDPADLWADVDDALRRFAELVTAGADQSFFGLLAAASTEIEVLTGCERVAIWGLAA